MKNQLYKNEHRINFSYKHENQSQMTLTVSRFNMKILFNLVILKIYAYDSKMSHFVLIFLFKDFKFLVGKLYSRYSNYYIKYIIY